jgi:hypothetical protein
MSGLAVGFAFASRGLFLHYRHAGPVHLHIQNGNRLTHDYGQVQLHGLADLSLLACGDVGANRLRRTFHRFGGHFQTGQNLHLLTAVMEGRRLAHHGLHAAYSRGEVCVFYVQYLIGGKLPFMAVVTQIPWTVHPCPTHHREHGPGTQFPIARLMSASAGQLTPIRRRRLELQQFPQSAGPGPMESGPQGALDGLQVGASAVATVGEKAAQQLIYFPRDFLMDCSSRFFSCMVQSCAA